MEADLIHWFSHTHLIVTYSVVSPGLDLGKKQRWMRHSPYLQRAQCGEREKDGNDYKLK